MRDKVYNGMIYLRGGQAWARLRKCDCRRPFAIGSETKKTCGSIGFEGGVVCLSLAGCGAWSPETVTEPTLDDIERAIVNEIFFSHLINTCTKVIKFPSLFSGIPSCMKN